MRFSNSPTLPIGLVPACCVLMWASSALAGGSPEYALVVIDPNSPESLYVGNYYLNARNIPGQNVLYFASSTTPYASFVSLNQDALFGTLDNRAVADHVDYVITTPGGNYFVAASGYVSDGCSPVTRFSLSGVYTMAFISSQVLAGGNNSQLANGYYSSTDAARYFTSSTGWAGGNPSASGPRYFIGAMLGFSGQRGNTLAETLAMIDRSVAVDGPRPAGTFYYMKTTDAARSGPRDPYYPAAVTSITNLGGQAQMILDVLPTGKQDCLGIMTGWADLNIAGAGLQILPGAFCDHLTSYAGAFEFTIQTKMSEWIRNGASGSWGTVEEPCNYPGKFPHARMHVFYFRGLSLGESVLRSVAYVPFQGLLYGDPLTRPFAYLPSVNVTGVPAGSASGVVTLTPSAATAAPGALIAAFELYIDGVREASIVPGGSFMIDTRDLADGWHDLRVLAYDNTLIRSTGRWVGALDINNRGRAVTLSPAPATGDLATPFVFTIGVTGGTARETRLIQNERVVAAAATSGGALTVHGRMLGAGPVRVQAEAIFPNGTRVRSAPVALNIAYNAGAPLGQTPVAYGYRKFVRSDRPFVVELPATFDNSGVALTYEIMQNPTKSVIGGGNGPYRLLRPNAGAKGVDTLQFRVTGAGTSATVPVVIDFGVRPGDLNCDGIVDFKDINPFVSLLTDPAGWQATYPNCPQENGDANGDGVVDFKDINPFVALLAG
jgi:hypothetical protein